MQWPTYICELCRNIHVLGESKENTVIRLADNAKGFENKKAVIRFNTASEMYAEKESTNCAMQNTVKDITIDCGKGNGGAVGIYYVSSNLGRIENVNITAESGYCGVYFDMGTEGVFRDLKISGFDYGFDSIYTSPCVMENIDVSECRIAGMISNDAAIVERNWNFGDITGFVFRPGADGRLFTYDKDIRFDGCTDDITFCADDENSLLKYRDFPKKGIIDFSGNDYVLAEEFGAVPDGVTDSTRAIQAAMNSGKSVVLFGSGPYLITKTVKIPKTVKVIDFMYGNLFAGIDLVTGEVEAAFDICEESKDTLFVKNLSTHEQFYGYFRMIKHSVKRDVVMTDIYTPFCSTYFNTVGGSTVYIDNCFLTTGSYAQNLILKRRGYKPVFQKVIPWEFHSQKVFAKNLNIERGDIELFNDNSEIYIDGYKTEGPGTALKSVNGGITRINLSNYGIWQPKEGNPLYETRGSSFEISCAMPFCLNKDWENSVAYDTDGKKTTLFDAGKNVKDDCVVIKHFKYVK